MSSIQITGKVFKQNLGVASWGIRDMSGNEYRPVNMPEQLKSEGARVAIRAIEVDEGFSIHMWGTAVRIISFHTLSPH